MAVAGRVLVGAYLSGVVTPARGQGNPLCWYASERSFELCCSGDGESRDAAAECWNKFDTWYNPDFCCHELLPEHLQCYSEVQDRVIAKVHFLHEAAKAAEEAQQAEDVQSLDMFSDVYRKLLQQPVMLWTWACNALESPFLWSPDCECCEPAVGGEACGEDGARPSPREAAWLHAMCCFPTYARKAAEGDAGADAAMDAAIVAELGPAPVDRGFVRELGPSMSWNMDTGNWSAHGCLISVRAAGIAACDESHACPGFDCSYLRALVNTMVVIHATSPLPDMDLLLNAGDVSLDAFDPRARVFTRSGTSWTNTVALPFEWQMHPGQCNKMVQAAVKSGLVPWEQREPVLVWRGSNSNCRMPRCNLVQASVGDDGGAEAMRLCAEPGPGEERDCRWDLDTWLRFPRGRLVWLSNYLEAVDARFAGRLEGDCGSRCMTPALVALLEDEGLIGESMSMSDQAKYKYAIAVEGDALADRLYWQLFTGSVVLLPSGPWQHLAVTELMRPFEHFVPVRYDLADLAERLDWLRGHDDEARRIAERGQAFARRYFTCDGVMYFVDRLLRHYAALAVSG